MDHVYASNEPKRKIGKQGATYCCVPQCSQYAESGISFHWFPKQASLKVQWETKLQMGKPASNTMRVCSKHFLPTDYFPSNESTQRKKLKPDKVPSQNLPVRSHDCVLTSDAANKRLARAKRVETRKKRCLPVDTDTETNDNVNDNLFEEEGERTIPKSTFDSAVQVNLADMRTHRPSCDGVSLADILSNSFQEEKCTQVNFLPIWKDEDNTAKSDPSITLPDLLSTKDKLFTFTGLHSSDLLECLAKCVQDLCTESRSNKKILSVKDRIILTMVKIKQNMYFTAIGVLFGINRQTCSNYFKNMCPLLARVLKVVIPWPDQSEIRCNLPLSFNKFRDTRIILDCCEVTIEKCKCLKCRVLTYSQYKKNHTVKFNMGVAPSGLIIESSNAFGGRASDKHIVEDSQILNRLDYGDAVLVDKGYAIEKECLERNLKLYRPPFLTKKQQLSREEALSCAEIARARVHVERVFQRIREFEFMRGPVPWPLAPYFEDVLSITMGLTNLGPPVMNIDKFM